MIHLQKKQGPKEYTIQEQVELWLSMKRQLDDIPNMNIRMSASYKLDESEITKVQQNHEINLHVTWCCTYREIKIDKAIWESKQRNHIISVHRKHTSRVGKFCVMEYITARQIYI